MYAWKFVAQLRIKIIIDECYERLLRGTYGEVLSVGHVNFAILQQERETQNQSLDNNNLRRGTQTTLRSIVEFDVLHIDSVGLTSFVKFIPIVSTRLA